MYRYLYKQSKKAKAHIWTGSDTLCRLWSTGGIPNKHKFNEYDTMGEKQVCQICDKVRKEQGFDKNLGDFWKPETKDFSPNTGKLRKNRGRNKQKRSRVAAKADADFFKSDEWAALRVRVMEKYRCRCMMCGRCPQEDNVVIQVDHIKPRSKYPHLSLDFNNLQLLCRMCNRGKSNKYETDWRPTTEEEINEELDEQLLETSPL